MRDVRQIITGQMIAALQRGTVPWTKPWRADAGRPRSMVTGRSYRGVNVFLLGLAAAGHGYASPWWGTYRQITECGGQVRRGERSTVVVFWKTAQVTSCDPATGDPVARTVPVLRQFRVFNAAQAADLPAAFLHAGPGTAIARPQHVLDTYLATAGPALVHVPGDQAGYQPAADRIRLPLKEQFRSPEHYYATAFHEAGHSTGHPARLNRPGIADFDHFGSGRYAREELTAEMTSAMLCARTGIDRPDIFTNSASYISGWLNALSRDTSLVLAAAGHAERACELISPPQRQAAPDPANHPAVAPPDAVEPGAAEPRIRPPGQRGWQAEAS